MRKTNTQAASKTQSLPKIKTEIDSCSRKELKLSQFMTGGRAKNKKEKKNEFEV